MAASTGLSACPAGVAARVSCKIAEAAEAALNISALIRQPVAMI